MNDLTLHCENRSVMFRQTSRGFSENRSELRLQVVEGFLRKFAQIASIVRQIASIVIRHEIQNYTWKDAISPST